VRIGVDVSEKLDYTLGVFTVERHIRGKWVCKNGETLIQAPVPAHIIDKGIPTTGAASGKDLRRLLRRCPSTIRLPWLHVQATAGDEPYAVF
jgi:transposase